MDIRIGRPNDDAIVAVKKEVAVEPIRPGLDSEEKTQQGGAVGDHPGRRRHTGAEGEIAMRKIDCAGEKGAQNKRQQHPVLDRNIGRKRKKIKPDILPVEGIALSIGRLPEKAEDGIPRSNLAKGHEGSEDDRAACNDKAPWKLRGDKAPPMFAALPIPRDRAAAEYFRPARRADAPKSR